MPRVGFKLVWRCCLSIDKLGHAYPLPRLSVQKTIKYTRRLRYTWWILLKLAKNWTAILWPSTKHISITKYKKLNMTEHKTDMNITKYKKLNMTEHKTDMTNTKNWTAIVWQSTKQIWTLLKRTNTKNWTAILWRSTKQIWTLLNTKNWP